jgi:HPt (histidine-containing phosphotransfer) domain-containing protein
MAYDPGALDAALAAAVGDDPALMLELRDALLGSANKHVDMLEHARNDATWHMAAWRLKGLAASFGAMHLLTAANDALDAAPGDPVALRRVQRAIAKLI